MTLLEINLTDVLSETDPDDKVIVWAPALREGPAGQLVGPRRKSIPLTGGVGSDEVVPGPLMVQVQCKGIADTRPREVVVPEVGPVTLTALFDSAGAFTYAPPVVGRVALDAQRAEDAAVRAEAGAAVVGDAQTVLDARDETVAAVATLGDAQTVLTARDQAVTAAGTAEGIATTLPTTIQSELDARVPPAVSDAIAADGTVAAAAATAASAAAPAAVDAYAGDTMKRGTGEAQLSSASVIADLLPGRYQCSQSTLAATLGLPEGQRGTLLVDWVDAGGIYRRHKYEFGNAGERKVYRNTAWNGSWTGWKLEFDATQKVTPYLRGTIPSGVTPDTMMGSEHNGVWTFSSGYAADWGVPSNAASFLEVWSSGFSTLQEIKTMTTPVQQYRRRGYNGVWSYAWERIGATGTATPADGTPVMTNAIEGAVNQIVPEHVDPTTDYVAEHAALVADLQASVGPVSTGGKAALALVFDHGTTKARDSIWPMFKARGLTATMALCPEVHIDGKGDSRHLATNAEIATMISEGLDIASHSGDHGGAAGWVDIYRQIVTSREALESTFGVPVRSWVQPGYVLSEGNYGGFGSGQSAQAYTDTPAGRLLQKTYPVITGYVGEEYVYPLSPAPVVGMRRSIIEQKGTIDTAKAYIQDAIATGGKHVNFIHPYALADTTSGTYVTLAEYEAFLDWVVGLRDAGQLVVMTLPELAIAQG